MDDSSHHDGFLGRWRAKRERRELDRNALRSEFEIERPRGFAAVRAHLASVGELERERIRSHTEPAPHATPAQLAAKRARATSR